MKDPPHPTQYRIRLQHGSTAPYRPPIRVERDVRSRSLGESRTILMLIQPISIQRTCFPLHRPLTHVGDVAIDMSDVS
jgi:hypothetical protein